MRFLLRNSRDRFLGPLGPGPSRELLDGLTTTLGIRWAPGTVEAAVEASGGSPVYLVEVARLAAARGGLGPGDLPSTIGGIALAHLALLPPAAQAVARIGAVTGGGFSIDSVRALDPSGDASFARVVAGFLQLRRAGLIRGTRRDVHARYASWIAARAATEGAGAAAGIASRLHLCLAGDFGAAASQLEAAADQALQSVAVPEARQTLAEMLVSLNFKFANDADGAWGRRLDVLVVDALALAGPAVPPLPEALRADALQLAGPRSRKALAAAGSSTRLPGDAFVGAQAQARWRAMRLQALKQWGYVEYVFGRVELASSIAQAALEAIGQPLRPRAPTPGAALLFFGLAFILR
eukprot:tig00000282_g23837.t1